MSQISVLPIPTILCLNPSWAPNDTFEPPTWFLKEITIIAASPWAQPGYQCSDVVIMRDLTLGVSKMMKTPLARFENDTSTCYDRIVMNLVSAVFDRMEVPPGPIRLQEETLIKVVHYLKTGFGASTASYTSDTIQRIYGVGQGSKAGPLPGPQ